MKTIYLAHADKATLIADVKKLFPDYNGQIEYTDRVHHLHYVGDIPTAYNEQGVPTAWKGKQHINLYVPDNFNMTLSCQVIAPETPYNVLAV